MRATGLIFGLCVGVIIPINGFAGLGIILACGVVGMVLWPTRRKRLDRKWGR